MAKISSLEYSWNWLDSNIVHTTGSTSCTGTLVVVKHVINDNGGTVQASDFTLQVYGTNPNPNSFVGDETGVAVTINPGVYSVDENLIVGYSKTLSADCSGTILAGETKICTITNDDIPPAQLTVKKVVINDNCGTKTPGDFNIHVKESNSDIDVVGSPAIGSETGIVYTLPVGDYVVSEDTSVLGYSLLSISDDCAADGSITLASGDNKTCTITNDDLPPATATLIVKKVVINDNSGTRSAADFLIYVKLGDVNVIGSPDVGSETGRSYILTPGTYIVSEVELPSNYKQVV